MFGSCFTVSGHRRGRGVGRVVRNRISSAQLGSAPFSSAQLRLVRLSSTLLRLVRAQFGSDRLSSADSARPISAPHNKDIVTPPSTFLPHVGGKSSCASTGVSPVTSDPGEHARRSEQNSRAAEPSSRGKSRQNRAQLIQRSVGRPGRVGRARGQLESVLEQVVQLAVQEISKSVGSSLNALLLETAVKEQENRRLRVQLQSWETRGRASCSDGGSSPVVGRNKAGRPAGDEAAGSGRTKPEQPQWLHAPGGQDTQPGFPTDTRRLEQRGRVVEKCRKATSSGQRSLSVRPETRARSWVQAPCEEG
ncbi:unnamed protein product [Pleuronectes platessa]|uniref:Uncharacterized protein n=1 Tax=Pleuronectes platessa TaxID=8262 RepID=A0A9N7UAT2_PLEPL|nr:unnamed protein product [Pleuronectes platessa]